MNRFKATPQDPVITIVTIPNENCEEWKIMKDRYYKLAEALHEKQKVYINEADLAVVAKTLGKYEKDHLGGRGLDVILQDGIAIGFVTYLRMFDTGIVSEIYIDPDKRRAGYGHRLLNGVVERFKRDGCKYVELGVIVTNWPARKLYESLGFKPLQLSMALPL